MNAAVYHRSQSVEWSTPADLFLALHVEFGFTLDVCASADNAKCGRFYSIDDDGLTQPWTGVCWMNPPYGRTISRWVERARDAARSGATVVCLLRARTDTRWWHDHIEGQAEVRFIRGRLQFGDSGKDAPFPSAIVVFRTRQSGSPQ